MTIVIEPKIFQGSMRKTALRRLGARKGLKSLWDSDRFDIGLESRMAGHSCHKDSKGYRPWRRMGV